MPFLHVKCIFQGSTCDFSKFFRINRISLTWFLSQLVFVNPLDGTVGWKICTTKENFVKCPFNCSHIEWQLITYLKIAITSSPIERL